MSHSDFILSSVQEFLGSDIWWSGILDFMLSKCEPFHRNETITIAEHNIYQEYLKFLEAMIYNEYCVQNGVDPEELDNLIVEGIANSNRVAIQIQDQLIKSTDFLQFRSDMIAHNARIEEEVNTVMNGQYESYPKDNECYPIEIHEPEPNISNLPTLNLLPSPRNQRYRVNIQQSPRRKLMINPEMKNISMLPALLAKKSETYISTKQPIPPMKILKPVPVRLPPLGKSPRF